MDICEHLFRFILGGLRSPSALPAPPGQVPVEEGPSRIRNNSFNSDIMVEFRHNSAKTPPQDGLISSDHDDDDDDEEDGDDQNIKNGRSKGKKSVGIMGSERDDDNDNDAKVRRHWPLLSVESNINEKSEEYIERKKKAIHDQELQP